MNASENKSKALTFIWIALSGDVITLAGVTIYGFFTHHTVGSAGTRMLATFIPLVIAWFLIAPHLGVYDPRYLFNPRNLWRPFWAMVLAAPMAAWLRGVWLNAPILPIFVVVLGGISAIALLLWRSLFLFFGKRSEG